MTTANDQSQLPPLFFTGCPFNAPQTSSSSSVGGGGTAGAQQRPLPDPSGAAGPNPPGTPKRLKLAQNATASVTLSFRSFHECKDL